MKNKFIASRTFICSALGGVVKAGTKFPENPKTLHHHNLGYLDEIQEKKQTKKKAAAKKGAAKKVNQTYKTKVNEPKPEK
jgi:hypothetical protein